jgi:hypothetical protein
MVPAMIKTMENRGHRVNERSLSVLIGQSRGGSLLVEERAGRFHGVCRVEVEGGNPFLAERHLDAIGNFRSQESGVQEHPTGERVKI